MKHPSVTIMFALTVTAIAVTANAQDGVPRQQEFGAVGPTVEAACASAKQEMKNRVDDVGGYKERYFVPRDGDACTRIEEQHEGIVNCPGSDWTACRWYASLWGVERIRERRTLRIR